MSSSSSPKLSQAALREFLLETQESLEQVEVALVELERNPRQADASSAGVGRMFRLLHSVKGSCGFLGYPKLEELAHVGESLLNRIRERILPVDKTVISALLSVVDAIREVVDHIEAENHEGHQDYSDLTQHLSQILGSEDLRESSAASTPFAKSGRDAADEPAASQNVLHDSDPANGRSSVNHGGTPATSLGGQECLGSRPDRTVLDQFGSIAGSLSDSSSVGNPRAGRTPPPQENSRKSQTATPGRETKPSDGKLADSAVRIDVTLLDKMMLLAGELVLTRNRILQDKSRECDVLPDGVYRQLDAITSELQGCVMKSRMQPISTIWKQLPRMVRDVALGGFKQVRLETDGGDTELDKMILEAIREPLSHLLRNAIDHGIELPELRAALGKPAEGRVWMRAYHAGGQISMEIGDDGAGIDADAIRQRALEQGIVAPAQAKQMSDLALLNLIFQPGFSTAAHVTKLSGRGVGLDVVQTNITKLGGTIHVHSLLGEGTTFTLRIPLTLAIVQALIVKSAGDCYVIPQSSIVEIVRLQGAEAFAVLDASRGVANYCYRRRLLPIVPLRNVLELETSGCDSPLEDLILVVLKVHDRQFGLVVDRIVDTQEVVIKPLWQPLRAITVYAGATQLGDGTVALILDPVGLAGRAGLVLGRQDARPDNTESLSEADEGPAACVTRLETGERFALPTRGLKRIEKLMRARIKRLDGREMLEYEGEIIRAIDIAALYRRESPPAEAEAAESMDETASTMHVAFYASGGKTTALIVGPTVDIVRHPLKVRGKAHRPYVQFTTMIDDHLVELLDVDGMIRSVEPEWTGGDTAASGGSVGDD